MNDQQNCDFLCQILLIGNSKVGKSTLLQKFVDKKLNESSFPTIGLDFRTVNLYLAEKIIKLQIWDMAGKEQYQELCSNIQEEQKEQLQFMIFQIENPLKIQGNGYNKLIIMHRRIVLNCLLVINPIQNQNDKLFLRKDQNWRIA